MRPWVWVFWLLLGPTISSVTLEWYIFVAVSHDNHLSCQRTHNQMFIFRHVMLLTQKVSSLKSFLSMRSGYVSKRRYLKVTWNNKYQMKMHYLIRHHLKNASLTKMVVITKHFNPLPILGKKHYRQAPHLEVNRMLGVSRECLKPRMVLLSLPL